MACTRCAELEHSIDLATRYSDATMKVKERRKLEEHRREAHGK
jgi:hypothetical protein